MIPPEGPRDEDGPVEGREDRDSRERWERRRGIIEPPVFASVPVLPVTYSTVVHVLGIALVGVVAYLAIQVFLNTGRLTALEAVIPTDRKSIDDRFTNLAREISDARNALSAYATADSAARDRANDKQDLAIGLLNQRLDALLHDFGQNSQGTIMRDGTDGVRRR